MVFKTGWSGRASWRRWHLREIGDWKNGEELSMLMRTRGEEPGMRTLGEEPGTWTLGEEPGLRSLGKGHPGRGDSVGEGWARKKSFKGLRAAGRGCETRAACAGREPQGQTKSHRLCMATGFSGPFYRHSVTSSSLRFLEVSRQMRTLRSREGTGLVQGHKPMCY